MVFPIHAFETYQGGFLSAIDFEAINKAGFKIVLDYSYGSSSRIFPSILGKLNCEVIALSANIDGTKLTRTGEEFSRALSQLSTIVRSLNADMGFLLDAGGEKVFLVDNAGDIIDGETALNLITLLVLKTGRSKKEKGAIAVPVTASRAIEEMSESHGFSVVRTKTTSRASWRPPWERTWSSSAKIRAGFIFPKFQPIFDGMYAIAKILEMIAREKTDLHKLVSEIPPSVMIKDRVMCNWENKGVVMRRLAEDSRGKDTTLIDGIRINFGDDWILAYPEPEPSLFSHRCRGRNRGKGAGVCFRLRGQDTRVAGREVMDVYRRRGYFQFRQLRGLKACRGAAGRELLRGGGQGRRFPPS